MPNRPRGRPRGTQTRLLHEHAGHLGRHHFAFLRALLDSVELEQAGVQLTRERVQRQSADKLAPSVDQKSDFRP